MSPAFRPRLAVLAAPLAAFLALASAAAPSAAQVVRAFTPRFSTNTSGDVTLIGNTIMTCSGGGGCNQARNGTGGNRDNNDFNMVYVDVDGVAGTFSSSTANLNLPAGATVLWAGLYWGGESNNGARNTVQFGTPVAGYVTLTAAQLSANGTDYAALVDVTTRVQAGGNGTYRVANVYSTPNQSNKHAGWSLVVVYGLNSLPLRNLVVFDGYAHVSSGNNVTINVSGFVTPPAGAVSTRLGVVGFEGDLGLTGDNFRLNGVNVSDARNPANNFFNSSISLLGAAFTTKNPNYVNQLGFDADLVTANGVLPNGATSATILLTSSGDEYYPAAVTFATDLYAPVFSTSGFTKTVADVNGAPVRAGDVLEYVLTMTNSGQDHATQSVLRDTIPSNTTYVPGSLTVVSGPNAGAKSDVAGDDQMEYVPGSRSVVARLGTGASAANGGQMNIGVASSVRFRVTVNPPALTDTLVSNQGWLSFTAAQSGQGFVARSDGDPLVPAEQPTVVTTVSTGVALDGRVYDDADHDGDFAAPEAGTGATLYVKLVPALSGAAIDAVAADPVTGLFTFGVVVAGTYDLVLDTNNNFADVSPAPPAGWIGTEAASGVRAGVVVGSTGISGLDFGLWHGSRADGVVFRDDGAGGGTANDGARQAGEAAVAGVNVRLESAACAGGVCDSVLTAGDGSFTLWQPHAAAGSNAALRETGPAGWLSTGGHPGSTGGAYDRNADAVAFVAVSGALYTGVAFGDVPPNQWMAPGAATVSPGGVATFPHTYTARSSGSVTFAASQAPSPAIPGWSLELFRDLDCDGAIDAGEPPLAAPVPLATGEALCVVARHLAPVAAPPGARETATLTASFSYAGAAPALGSLLALDDVTSVAASGLVIAKSVDLATARPGDTLTYTITYTNLGPLPVSSVVIRDATPPYTRFASAACAGLGAGLSACNVSVQPSPGGTGPVNWTFAGSLLPGGSGSVTLVVTLE